MFELRESELRRAIDVKKEIMVQLMNEYQKEK